MAVEWKKPPPIWAAAGQAAGPAKLEVLLMQVGFRKIKDLYTDGYHYAVLFEK